MMIRNNNPRFGETMGTVEADSIDALVADMDETLVAWAKESDDPFPIAYPRICSEFRAGLEVAEPEGVKIGPGW